MRHACRHVATSSLPDTDLPLPSRRAAFTLIEVLVTLVILSTGIVLVLRAFGTCAVALGASRDVLRQSVLAGDKVEEIEAALLDGVQTGYGVSHGSFAEPYDDYDWEARVRPIVCEGPAGEIVPGVLHAVEISVWRTGMDQRHTLMTYVRVPPVTRDEPGS